VSSTCFGQELYISETTVKTHITHILQKLNVRDRVQAVVLAYETVRPSGGSLSEPSVTTGSRRRSTSSPGESR
jgi:hypothetical protein